MMLKFICFPIFIVLSACASHVSSSYPYPEQFKVGQVIPDQQPLASDSSTDLREIAFTLPIIEFRDNMDWYYQNSEDALAVDKWRVPADGIQDPAVVVRLPLHKDGSQQIELQYTPIPEEDNPTYFSVLKRLDEGWVVLKTWQKNNE